MARRKQTNCLERLWSLPHWMYSRTVRTQSCTLGWPCLSRWPTVGPSNLTLWFCDFANSLYPALSASLLYLLFYLCRATQALSSLAEWWQRMAGTNSKEVLTSNVGVTKFQKLAELCLEQSQQWDPCCNLSQIICISQLARLSIWAAQATRQAHAVESIPGWCLNPHRTGRAMSRLLWK